MPKIAKCHPEKRHIGYGYCSMCYPKYKRSLDPLLGRNKSLFERYGIRHVDYLDLFEKQKGVCNLCNAFLGKLDKDPETSIRLVMWDTFYRDYELKGLGTDDRPNFGGNK